MRKKQLALIMASLLPASASAMKFDNGFELQGQFKAMHVLSAEDNGYDPYEGTGYLAKLKVLTPDYDGLRVGAAGYLNGDLLGFTDFYSGHKLARGMFVNGDGDSEGQLGEVYARYEKDDFHAFGGRMLLSTPLTENSYSLMPNFYTAFGGGYKPVEQMELEVMHITEMSFGSRAMTDFGLIGEGTGTAGAAVKPDTIGQAEFHDIDLITLGPGAESTDGITAGSLRYDFGNKMKLEVWDYYAHDIANNFYADLSKVLPLGDKRKLKLSGQLLAQTDAGAALAGPLDFNLAGVKAAYVTPKWSGFAAFTNSSGDSAMLNAWGGDPAYTSSIFSRNEYRENVNAWKVGFKYKIMQGLAFVASHARYSESDTLGKVGGVGSGLTAQDDADETDLVLVYKPRKGLTFKTLYADRTSEYDGSNGKDLSQGHWRLVMNYAF